MHGGVVEAAFPSEKEGYVCAAHAGMSWVFTGTPLRTSLVLKGVDSVDFGVPGR